VNYLKRITIFVILAVATVATAENNRFDGWFEMSELFGSSSSGDMIWNGRGERFSIDYSTKVQGDFSVVYTSDSISEKELGFMTPSYAGPWEIGLDWELSFSVKSDNTQPTKWALRIIDEKGGKAFTEMDAVTSNSWQTVSFKADSFKPSYTKFDFTRIIACQITASIQPGQQIWFDNIFFTLKNGSIFGVMEKTVEQRMAEAAATKQKRIDNAIDRAQTKSPSTVLNAYFAKLYFNRETEEINKKLYIIFTTKNAAVKKQFGLFEPWHPYLDSMLFRMYFTFNRTNGTIPRFTRETEQALLDLIWERNRLRNDINIAKQSSWWIVNGESFDLCFKSAALLSSQIFKDMPEYRKLELNDSGKGGGFGYWFQYKNDIKTIGPEGRGVSPASTATIQEHYDAWVKFLKDYFAERGKKGFFIENASPVYSKYTINYVYDIYDYCADTELKKLARQFIDLYWADWLQDSIAGMRGGAKLREYAELDGRIDITSVMLEFHLGGNGLGEMITINQLLSDYELPKVLWSIALDRTGLGEFAFISRRPGAENPAMPRPLGTERTFMCDVDSGIVRYSWVTPDYVMGSIMRDPAGTYNRLSASPTWQGVQLNTSPKAMVMPRAIDVKSESNFNVKEKSGFFRSVQHENVMITAQARTYNRSTPAWFLEEPEDSSEVGVYFGDKPDRLVEKRGWIIIQEGNSYIAVRPVRSYYEAGETFNYLEDNMGEFSMVENRSYEWNLANTIAKASGKFCPIIIEAARVNDYGTMQEFVEHIEESQIMLVNGIVPEAYALLYKTKDKNGKPLEFYFNAANNEVPMINGERLNYRPDNLFKSPYMQSLFGSGVTTVMRGNDDMTASFF
jgi:hypothetical protein